MTDRPGAAYIEATAGVAGDMLLAALLDAGADAEQVRAAIASLAIPSLGLRTEAARRGGLACLRAVITTPAATDRPRHLADVVGLAAALEDLGLLRPGAVVCCSALAAGNGFVTSRHGRLSVPAPPSSASPPRPAWTWPAAT